MKTKFYIQKKSFSARVSLVLIILAIPFIVIGKFSLLTNFALNNIPLVTEVFLPIIGCMLFIVSLLLLGKIFFAFSFLPVFLCMVPIVLQGLKIGTIVGIGEVVICFLTVILYTCLVFGAIQIKIIPALLFVIEILYRLYFYIYKQVAAGISFGVQEAFYHVAIIFMLTAFLFAVIALDKKIKVVTDGKEIIPPIPGSHTLGKTPAPVHSDPPLQAAANIESIVTNDTSADVNFSDSNVKNTDITCSDDTAANDETQTSDSKVKDKSNTDI